jgi:hypothetical protein
MVASLLEHETVDTEEVAAILSGTPYPAARSAEAPPSLPIAAAVPTEPEVREMPRRLPPNISPEPA